MKKIALGLMLVAATFTVACGGSDTPADTTPVEQTPQTMTINMFGYQFNPNSLTIPAGTTVNFTNKDPENHSVTITALGVDQVVEPGKTFTFTFTTQGEFAVSNRLATNPMAATITVQ